ncbi:MAG: DASH family cryptochrome, partial [Winogradskyella sp.]|uniref:DASH family cryptochrome n=1 Tax=Winogradskyella sp. TaxID=1883156 RepID=UPI0017BC3DC4|nr:DASH family cryptochrome [Winogradskyella sp.]
MQKKQINANLVWFRNDLRVNDNTVLYKASKNSNNIIGVFCFDPRNYCTNEFGFIKSGKFRTKFLIETISVLKAQLKSLNIELLVFYDLPENIIPQVCLDYRIGNVYYQKEWTQEEADVEHKVISNTGSVNFHAVTDQFLYHPEDINFDVSNTPMVFTVFRKKLEKHVDVRDEQHIEKLPADYSIENNTQIPKLRDLGFEDFVMHPHSAFLFKGGETEALSRLNDYFFKTKKLGFYKKTRNGLVGADYSSKFSAWLANGSISPRTIYWKVKQFEKEVYKNQSTYWLIFELIWRDYFKYISMKFGNQIFKLEGILQKKYDWATDQVLVRKWINGETQSDFVNANMIELKKTGWMSNRGRQNVASYFAKELKLDWRIGASYFESLLIDYDVHSNYGNWMYVAGVGNDPRHRKFNVQMQSERYDANAKFR